MKNIIIIDIILLLIATLLMNKIIINSSTKSKLVYILLVVTSLLIEKSYTKYFVWANFSDSLKKRVAFAHKILLILTVRLI